MSALSLPVHFMAAAALPALPSQTALLLSEILHFLTAPNWKALPSQTALFLSGTMRLCPTLWALPALPSPKASLLSAHGHLGLAIGRVTSILSWIAAAKKKISSSTVKAARKQKIMQMNMVSHLTGPAHPRLTSPMPW